jgi:arsenate reductase
MSEKIYNVLFLSTGNSARSIMAEAILNHTGKDRFRAFSAGSKPDDKVNPFAIEQIQLARISTNELQCKNWNTFTSYDAPVFDFVFTVCGEIKLDNLPAWKGQPLTANWSVDDPNLIDGSISEKRKAFLKSFTQINWRLSIFTSLSLTNLNAPGLKIELENISKLEDRRKSELPRK